MPAAGMIDFEKATKRDLGGDVNDVNDVNDVVYVSRPFASRHGFLTANDVTPYAWGSLSTKDGPLVVEVPPANQKVGYFGTIVNTWDVPLIDVGTTGHDKGNGAKYLILPPGYDQDVPDGFVPVPCDSYNSGFAFRPVMKEGATFEDTTAYAKELKLYYLSEASDPPPTRVSKANPGAPNQRPGKDYTESSLKRSCANAIDGAQDESAELASKVRSSRSTT